MSDHNGYIVQIVKIVHMFDSFDQISLSAVEILNQYLNWYYILNQHKML